MNIRILRVGLIVVIMAMAMTIYVKIFHPQINNIYKEKINKENLHKNCQCKSLFFVGGCDPASLTKLSRSIPNINSIISDLKKARNLLPTFFDRVFNRLSSYLPFKYAFQYLEKSNASHIENEFKENSTMFVDTELPYIPCQLHLYTPPDVKTCLLRHRSKNMKPVRIAFVGDSTIRIYMESLVQFLEKELNIEVKLNSRVMNDSVNSFLKGKVKHNLPLIGEGIEMTLLWAPGLGTNLSVFAQYKHSIKETFETLSNWAEINSTRIPDFIVIGYGSWYATMISHVEGFSKHLVSAREMLDTFSKLAKKATVLWQLIPPSKTWNVKYFRPHGIINFMNHIRTLGLLDPSVWVWDSVHPVTYKEIKECQVYKELHYLDFTPESWRCKDYVHAGVRTRNTGNNMILNLVCNKLLNFATNYCCS